MSDMEFEELFETVQWVLCALERTSEDKKNNKEYAKALTDAGAALRTVLRFW